MKKGVSLLLVFVILLTLTACSVDESNAIHSTEKTYEIEIDGEVYYADSQEEIDEIVNKHIFGDLDILLDSGIKEHSTDENISNSVAPKALVIGEWIHLNVDGIGIQFRFDGFTPIQDKGRHGTFVMMLCAIENVSDSDFDAYFLFKDTVKVRDKEGFTLPPSHSGWDYDMYGCDTNISSGEKKRIVKAFAYNGEESDLSITISNDGDRYIYTASNSTTDQSVASDQVEQSPIVSSDVNDNTNVVAPTDSTTDVDVDGLGTYNTEDQNEILEEADNICVECGIPSSRYCKNPLSGNVELYCEVHYQEMVDTIRMIENMMGDNYVSSLNGKSNTENDVGSSNGNNNTENKVSNSNRHTESEAFACAKDILRGYLKSPSTAKFCWITDATITHLGNGEYKVTGWVDAENSFGAMLRQNFVVTYTATSRGYKNGSASVY